MKRIVLTLSLLTGMVLMSDAQTRSRKSFDPIMKMESDIHDYGTIKQGADGNCEFKFTNEGKDRLYIDSVISACACIVTKYPKRGVKPGKSGVIKVYYFTKRVGPIDKTIVLKTNARQEMITLRLKGLVEPL